MVGSTTCTSPSGRCGTTSSCCSARRPWSSSARALDRVGTSALKAARDRQALGRPRGAPAGPTSTCEPGVRAFLGGRNGAGKTTLLRICAGLIEPHAGEVALQRPRTRARPAGVPAAARLSARRQRRPLRAADRAAEPGVLGEPGVPARRGPHRRRRAGAPTSSWMSWSAAGWTACPWASDSACAWPWPSSTTPGRPARRARTRASTTRRWRCCARAGRAPREGRRLDLVLTRPSQAEIACGRGVLVDGGQGGPA